MIENILVINLLVMRQEHITNMLGWMDEEFRLSKNKITDKHLQD